MYSATHCAEAEPTLSTSPYIADRAGTTGRRREHWWQAAVAFPVPLHVAPHSTTSVVVTVDHDDYQLTVEPDADSTTASAAIETPTAAAEAAAAVVVQPAAKRQKMFGWAPGSAGGCVCSVVGRWGADRQAELGDPAR
eukprot:SAG22_NODE_1520_length_4237_cov_11.486225_4_plen_138_part_00